MKNRQIHVHTFNVHTKHSKIDQEASFRLLIKTPCKSDELIHNHVNMTAFKALNTGTKQIACLPGRGLCER